MSAIPHYVSEDECVRMRELADDGIEIQEITVQVARARRTVRRHVAGRCQHVAPERSDSPTEADLIKAIHQLAEEIGRVPTIQEWRDWDERPYNSKTVESNLGGTWREAIKRTDLPLVAKGSTKPIRTAAYQKPSLCSSD